MTDSSKQTLERIARRVPVPEPAYERVLLQRDRRGRNQRIAAGVVGLALFVGAIGVVTIVGSSDPGQTPSVTGRAGTGPTGSSDPRWDGHGIPPEGTMQSSPAEGELVAEFAQIHVGYVFVYADGRVIWRQGSLGSSRPGTGQAVTNERRLTPEGVELARSGAVDASAFLPPWTSLPPNVWVDETKLFVPSRYAVCYSQSRQAEPGAANGGYEYPSTLLRFFPAEARAILRGNDHSYERSVGVLAPGPVDCSEVTTDEARALVALLSDVRVEDSEGDRLLWEIHEVLPHGEWVVLGG